MTISNILIVQQRSYGSRQQVGSASYLTLEWPRSRYSTKLKSLLYAIPYPLLIASIL
ncbi:hypothetical protein RR46_04420 [Papilio xuthus]|uniref:Uncharacterized protein n=1 Tax=Papilio xuthus TaxID=66420 RepID=A0A194PLZ8_PAPXU|nr:hypothetical protein RR46_04420 [Papilio xuthus]